MRSDGEFDLRRLETLRNEALGLVEQLGPLHGPNGGCFVGWDPQGAVEVAVDGTGRVTEVRLDPQWRDVVRPHRLGPAVVSAVREASAARLTALAQAFSEGPGRPVEAVPADYRQVSLGQPGDPASAESVRNIRDLLTLLEAFEGQLARLDDVLEQQTTREITGTSPNRTVTVTVASGTVTAVRFDQQWLAATNHARLASAVHDALRDAQDRAGAAERETVDGFPAVAEVQALAAQPEALLRKLGLLG